MSVRKFARVRSVAAAATLTLGMSLGVVALTAPEASAHGAVTDPPSRSYQCFRDWSEDWQSPLMATQDPMCDNAWKTNPNAMWNWNGQYLNDLAGNYQAAVPSGALCSAGHSQNGQYDAMDVPGNWRAQGVPSSFKLTLTDGSDHGADFIKVYVTKAGFDPTTQKVGWENLDLVTTTGKYPTADPYVVDVNLAGHSGRAVLFTIWKASHADQTYFFCSDINIGGGNIGGGDGSTPPPTDPTTPPTNPTTPPTNPTTPPTDPTTPPTDPTTPPPTDPTPPTGDKTCTATVKVVNSWQGGYQADVTVKAGSSAITGWKATVAGATITQAWGSKPSGNVLTNESWNGSLAVGASTTAGFIGSGTPPTSATCTAG